MSSPLLESAKIARFGAFEVDLQSGELRKYGIRIKVHGQPVQILKILLESANQVVPRDELRNRLWAADTFVEFEHSLNTAVKRLRQALADSADDPHYIETLPRVGYRFIAPVSFQQTQPRHSASVTSVATRDSADADARLTGLRSTWLRWQTAAGAMLIFLCAFVAYALLSPTPVANLARSYLAITSDHIDAWQRPITDGVRVYLLERAGDHRDLVQTSVSGGELLPFPAPFRNTRILDISRDRSRFLIGRFERVGHEMTYWFWPVQGGSPVRIGTATGADAAWGPDGSAIIYSAGTDIRTVDSDGKNDRLLLHTGGRPGSFRWSPEGDRLGYTVGDFQTSQVSIWEASADGSNAHLRFGPHGDISDVCCGEWTPDGKYFLFVAIKGGVDNIWAIRESRSLFHWRKAEPRQLTFSATPLYSLSSLIGGSRLFALGERSGFESVKLNLATGATSPVLPGTQVAAISFSKDGKQLAYSITPYSSIWRTDLSGNSRFQLVAPPLQCDRPQWSPDGKKIAFEASLRGSPLRAYTVDVNDGTVREPLNIPGMQSLPYWSPDGKSLAVAANVVSRPGSHDPRAIYIIDLATGRADSLANSTGLTIPMWSPDGKYFTAKPFTEGSILLYNADKKVWSEIATGESLAGPVWSPDSKYLYFQEMSETGQPLFRLRTPDFKRERVFSFESFLAAGLQRCALEAISPDGSPIISLTRSSARAYIFDFDFP
ncbi:MAG TPA: winged helix-turn-helix domain-containing protein [Candidatus Acidoferrales bacterium]|nr:winged helix-turn-helix domain-containing protein [Candidatus Acidoferrales bacterium]